MRIIWYISDLHACGHVRGEIIAKSLNERYDDVIVSCKQNMMESDLVKTDVMVFQRQHLPFVHKHMKKAKEAGITVIFDTDDDLFNIPKEYRDGYIPYSDPGTRMGYMKAMLEAQVVTVSTKCLNETLDRFIGEIPRVVMPNGIDFDYWNAHSVARVRRETETMKSAFPGMSLEEGPLTIGWMASGAHCINVPVIRGALEEIMRKYSDVHLKLIGLHDPDNFGGWMETFEDRIVLMKWVNIVDLPGEMKDFSIGLAPLAKTEFNSCKSNIKWLQHSALEIPTVASRVAPFIDTTATLCGDKSEWVESLSLLIEDGTLRRSEGSIAMDAAIKYDVRHVSDEWLELFKELRGKREHV